MTRSMSHCCGLDLDSSLHVLSDCLSGLVNLKVWAPGGRIKSCDEQCVLHAQCMTEDRKFTAN